MIYGKKMRLLALLGATLAVGACDSSTGPAALENFDSQAALEDYQAVDAILNSTGWAGFQALGTRVPIDGLGSGVASALGAVGSVADLAAEGDPRSFAEGMARMVGAMTAPAGAPIISGESRGTTFIFDPEIGDYRPDPNRSDAPANGVRFVLYDESSGQPDPATEIGYADLIDEGDASAADIVLRFIVVQGQLTVLDYRTSLTDLGSGGRITVDGFLQDETDRLDFDVNVEGTDGENLSSIDVRFTMGIESRDFSINGAVTGTEGASESGTIDISVRHGSESLRVALSGSDTVMEGTFFLNGEVFATAAGDPDDPTFTSSDGSALGMTEVQVLTEMVGVVDEVFGLFEGLVEPIEGLVALGIVL
jgi:hypothetical protein